MRNWSENQITLVLIRHGATKSNKEHRYLGRTQEALMREGIEELRKYKKEKRYPSVDYLFSSPMKRCVETAEIIYPDLVPVLINEWEEMDFGDFEGKNYIDLKEDARYQAWIDSNATLPFPKGESREVFILRCMHGFQKMREQLLQSAQESKKETLTVGMVVHGGTIMALLSRYGGGNYFDYQAPNGGGYVGTLKDWRHEPEIIHIRKI